MTKCGYCRTNSEQEYPSNWYAVSAIQKQFCNYKCLVEYVRKHDVPLDTQWVRWR